VKPLESIPAQKLPLEEWSHSLGHNTGQHLWPKLFFLFFSSLLLITIALHNNLHPRHYN
jgi:hypothetical protein